MMMLLASMLMNLQVMDVDPLESYDLLIDPHTRTDNVTLFLCLLRLILQVKDNTNVGTYEIVDLHAKAI